MYINQIWNLTHLTFDSYAVRNMWEMPEGFRHNFTVTVPLTLKDTGEYIGYETIKPDGYMSYTLIDKYNNSEEWKDIWTRINTCTVSYYTETPYVTLNH